MELYQLQTFIIVAEEESITKAAKRLFATPSSVSMHIKALEDELRVQLFVRTSRGMQITEKGQVLYEKARKTLYAAQDLVNHATELQSYLMGQLSIGLNASATFLHVPALIAQMTQECPGIDLSFVSSASGHIIEDVVAEKLDVGFVFGEVSDTQLMCRHLQVTELVVAVPKAWEERVRDADWAQVAELAWIFSDYYCPFQVIVDDLLAQRGLEVKQVVKSDDDKTRAQLVVSGVGMSLLEISEARELVEQGKIALWESDAIHSDLSLIYLARRQNEPLIKAIIAQVMAIWGK